MRFGDGDHIIAAHETTGTTLTYASYHLSRNPKLQSDLRSELAALKPPILTLTNITLPSPASIDRLPLLEAVVKETLRLNAPTSCREPRLVPSGGLQLHGFHTPAGTTVSCNPYCLHRNGEVFPRPFERIPQRWIPDEEAKLEKEDVETSNLVEMKCWFWAFSSGGRMCIGSNLAIQSTYLPRWRVLCRAAQVC